jgi:hypothetical protein
MVMVVEMTCRFDLRNEQKEKEKVKQDCAANVKLTKGGSQRAGDLR